MLDDQLLADERQANAKPLRVLRNEDGDIAIECGHAIAYACHWLKKVTMIDRPFPLFLGRLKNSGKQFKIYVVMYWLNKYEIKNDGSERPIPSS